jgi:hypothetical protein
MPFDFQFNLTIGSGCHNTDKAVLINTQTIVDNCKDNYKTLFNCDKDLICKLGWLWVEVKALTFILGDGCKDGDGYKKADGRADNGKSGFAHCFEYGVVYNPTELDEVF